MQGGERVKRHGVALFAAVVIAGCGGGSGSGGHAPAAVTISGDLVLFSGNGISRAPGPGLCQGMNGFGDLSEGTEVTVTDNTSKIVAVGRLAGGVERGRFKCVFPIYVSNVPRSDFYGIEVAHRGVVHYSLSDVEAGPVHLTID